MKRHAERLSWFALLALLAGVGGMAFSAVQEKHPDEPSVFRKLTPRKPFPKLTLLDFEDQAVEVEPILGEPSLIAFLRLDQVDSTRLLSALETLALDAAGPRPRVTVVSMRGRKGWADRLKALPTRMRVFIDPGKTAEQLGVIVLPSLAVLDADGLLWRAHVLYDDDLVASVRHELELLQQGGGEALDAEEQSQRQVLTWTRNASALEAAGKLEEALALRRRLFESQVESARLHADLGRTLFLMGDAAAAANHFRSSLAIEETVATRVWLGRALSRTGERDEALRILRQALPLSPQKAIIHRELAALVKAQGDLEQALTHLKAAIAARRAGNGEVHDG